MLKLPRNCSKLRVEGSSLLLLHAAWFLCLSIIFRVLHLKSRCLYGSMSSEQAYNKTSLENSRSLHTLRQLGNRRYSQRVFLPWNFLSLLLDPCKLLVSAVPWSKVPQPNYRPRRKPTACCLFWNAVGCCSGSDSERDSEHQAGLSPSPSRSGLARPVTCILSHLSFLTDWPWPFALPWTLYKSIVSCLRWGNQSDGQEVCTVGFVQKHIIFLFSILSLIMSIFIWLLGSLSQFCCRTNSCSPTLSFLHVNIQRSPSFCM